MILMGASEHPATWVCRQAGWLECGNPAGQEILKLSTHKEDFCLTEACLLAGAAGSTGPCGAMAAIWSACIGPPACTQR